MQKKSLDVQRFFQELDMLLSRPSLSARSWAAGVVVGSIVTSLLGVSNSTSTNDFMVVLALKIVLLYGAAAVSCSVEVLDGQRSTCPLVEKLEPCEYTDSGEV